MPVSVNMPNRREEKDPLDTIVKGLSIAQSVYGINQDGDKAAALKEQRGIDNANKTRELDLKKEEIDRKANAPKDLVGLELKYERLRRLREEGEAARFAKTPEGRLKGLNGEAKQRLDNAKLGLISVQGMRSALGNGDNTFSVIGDNDFTQQRNLFEEALGRMQSGGAITLDESNKFRKMAPGFFDDPAMRAKKLQQLENEMQSRLSTLGFQPEELGIASTKPALISPETKGAFNQMTNVLTNPAQAGTKTPGITPGAAKAELLRRKGLGAAKLPGK